MIGDRTSTPRTQIVLMKLWLALAVCSILSNSALAVAEVARATPDAGGDGQAREPMTDASLAPHQIELLERAFDVASSYPLDPHIKNRSQAQMWVVEACLELDQPARAAKYGKQIVNWRQGQAMAEVGHYCIEHGWLDEAHQYLKRAALVAGAEGLEPWRSVRVRQRVLEGYETLGLADQAEEVQGEMWDHEVEDRIDAMRALRGGRDRFDEQMEQLKQLTATENYDLWVYAAHQYARLYDRYYTEADLRDRVEEALNEHLDQLHWFVDHEILVKMAQTAIEAGDDANADRLLDRAHEVVKTSTWPWDEGITAMAELAPLWVEADRKEKARSQAEATLELYEAQREHIRNYDRAKALRPIAAAYQSLGDESKATELYSRVVDLGTVNPNIRPRTNDLTQTCLSMALHGFEPDDRLWPRIRQIYQELVSK